MTADIKEILGRCRKAAANGDSVFFITEDEVSALAEHFSDGHPMFSPSFLSKKLPPHKVVISFNEHMVRDGQVNLFGLSVRVASKEQVKRCEEIVRHEVVNFREGISRAVDEFLEGLITENKFFGITKARTKLEEAEKDLDRIEKENLK